MGSCEELAVILAYLSEPIVLFLQDELGRVSCPLVVQVLKRLVGRIHRPAVSLVALLLRQDVVLVLNYEVYVLGELVMKFVELR